MDRESDIVIDTPPGVKETASGKLPNSRELNLGLCDDLEGWDGMGLGGKELKREGMCVYI